MAFAVLVVCLGNICRSPMAQGALEAAARDAGVPLHVDSAGTSGWHEGDGPDPRAIAAARRRGWSIARQRARSVAEEDFRDFDLILAVDARNLAALRAMAPAGATARLGLLLDEAPGPRGRDVPDPYYEGPEAFDAVAGLAGQAAGALVARLAAGLAAHPAAPRAPVPQDR